MRFSFKFIYQSAALATCLFGYPCLAQPSTSINAAQPAKPAASSSYDELWKKGESLLAANTSANNNRSAAISVFIQAAQSAPDDDKKYKALMRAAEVATQIKNYRVSIDLFNSMRALTKVPDVQKAIAQFGYAFSRHQDAKATRKPLNIAVAIQADYETALKMPQLPEKLRAQGHEAIGDLLVLRGQRIAAVREYQKILPLAVAKNEASQKYYSNRIFTELRKVAPSTDALGLAETTFQQVIPLQKTPAAIASAKDHFAQALVAQNQPARAVILWNELADDKNLPLSARVDVLRKVGAVHRSLKTWPEASKTADKIISLSGATPDQLPSLKLWRSQERAATFRAQGDEPKARAEWESMMAQLQSKPDEKATLWMEIAKSYRREMVATQKVTLISQQKQAFENAWNSEGAKSVLRTQALLERGQLDINSKNPTGAITLLNDGLKKVEAWPVAANDKAYSKRAIYLALANIYRSQKNYDQATASLIQAQQFSKKSDAQVLKAAIGVSQDAFKAKQWKAARATLLALQNAWGISRKAYVLNLLAIEVAEQKWAEARKLSNELATQTLTAPEKKSLDTLRARIPVA